MHTQSKPSGHVRLVNRKRGAVWYARIRRADGSHVQRKIGAAWTGKGRPGDGHYTERTAHDELVRMIDRINEEAGRPSANGGTFGFAKTGWLMERERRCAPATLRDYRTTATALTDRFGADTPIEAITLEDVEQYLAALRDENTGQRTVTRRLTVLGGIFRWTERRYGIRHNPAAALTTEGPKYRSSGRIDFLTPEEIAALVRATADPQDAAMFLAAALTGLRQGELLALTWADVDFGLQRVHVRRSWCNVAKEARAPKSGKVRSVPMADEVVAALDTLSKRERFTDPDDLVFPAWDGGTQYHGDVRIRFYAALRAAKLKRIRFHDLRHTFGTLAAQKFPLTSVQAMMGHANIQTTMIYAHYVPAADEAALLGQAFRTGVMAAAKVAA